MLPSRCFFCDHDNPAGAKYCNECGSPLHLIPCKCGAVNNVTDACCHRCGADVSGPRTPAPSMPLEAQVENVDLELVRVFERQLEEPAAEQVTPPKPQCVGDAPAPEPHFAELEQQPQVQVSSPGGPNATAAAPLAGNPAKDRHDRRHGYMAAALVLAIVAAAAAGVVSYDRYAPWLARSAGAPRAPVADAPSPGTAVTASPEAATASPRPEVASTPTPPQPSRIDAPTTSPAERDVEKAGSLPAAPSASTSPAAGGPIESRAAGGVGAPSTPTSAPPVPDPRCPPAVAAMALCERMAHADRR